MLGRLASQAPGLARSGPGSAAAGSLLLQVVPPTASTHCSSVLGMSQERALWPLQTAFPNPCSHIIVLISELTENLAKYTEAGFPQNECTRRSASHPGKEHGQAPRSLLCPSLSWNCRISLSHATTKLLRGLWLEPHSVLCWALVWVAAACASW